MTRDDWLHAWTLARRVRRSVQIAPYNEGLWADPVDGIKRLVSTDAGLIRAPHPRGARARHLINAAFWRTTHAVAHGPAAVRDSHVRSIRASLRLAHTMPGVAPLP